MSEEFTKVQDIQLDASNLSNKVLIGPQAEVLERVNAFNEKWGSSLSVTKTFRWSPGVYDKIKEVMLKQFLGWDKRSNSVYSFFNKIETNMRIKNTLRSELNSIDNILYNNRQDGMVFQENPEEMREYLNLFFDKLSAFAEYADNIEQNLYTWSQSIDHFNAGEINDFLIKMEFIIPITHIDVKIFDANTREITDVGKIPCYYTIKVMTSIPFVKWFNKFWTATQNNQDITSINGMNARNTILGKVCNEHPTIKQLHPYISNYADRYSEGHAVCWGDLQQDLIKYMINLNPYMFFEVLNMWANTFIIHKTNPYNAISVCFYGQPAGLDDDAMLKLGGNTSPVDCSYAHRLYSWDEDPDEYMSDEFNMNDYNYCDMSECQLRSGCEAYNHVLHGAYRPERYKFREGERSIPIPSWMAQDENGVWRDTRTIGNNIHGGEVPDDMQVESEMVSNDNVVIIDEDGGEREDRDGEPEVNGFDEFLRVNQDLIERGPSVDESDDSEPPF